MTISATTGFPRIGPDRELKRALESYWGGRLEAAGLRAQAAELRAGSWRLQQEAGISHIPSNDFSLYDHVLDTAVLLGAVPGRYGWSPGHEVDLDTYFAMARGAQTEGLDVPAMEMTKWFDTNYHYIVPELERDQAFGVSSSKPFDELAEARDLGIETRPVLLGPVSFLLLSKPVGDFRPLDVHLEAVAGTYAEIVGRLAALGARWIQLDEPCFVADRAPDEIAALETAYEVLAKAAGDARLLVHTYFGDVGDAYPTLVGLPVGGLGLDFVRGTRNLELLQRHGFPDGMVLQAGLVDGRNVWITDLEAAGRRMDTIGDVVDRDRLIVSPSCSLLHVPYDAERETEIEAEIRPWLSFARQKLDEVVALARWGASGREDLADVLERNRTAVASRAASRLTHDPSVRDRLADLDPFAACRDAPFAERRSLQRERLGLPTLPTTSIGSFPQHAEVRRQRRLHRSGELGDDAYRDFVRHEMARAIGLQERAGLDVLVHGEPERNDMVEYFGERFAGFAFSRHGWVQSYGSRCVKPPILYGDVRRPSPVTVEWWRLAQGLTDRPIKGMLTGPVTLLQWSFVRDDQPRSETCFQLALAVRDEVADLETAGAAVVQVDEPALREGLPLRRGEWDEYLEWAVAAFRLATSGVEPHTQIHTHMCYCEFNDIIDHIARMDADVLLIENARSDAELLEVFREYEYDRDIGPGVYDIHSPRVPPADEMADRIRASLGVLAADRLWVNPDCGLKTRRYEEVEPALENLVEAARRVRAEVEAGSPADR